MKRQNSYCFVSRCVYFSFICATKMGKWAIIIWNINKPQMHDVSNVCINKIDGFWTVIKAKLQHR